jgi:hypothetical protein
MEVVGRNGTGRVLLRIWWVTPVRVQIPSLAPSFSGLFTTGTIRQWCKFGANEIKGQLDGLSFFAITVEDILHNLGGFSLHRREHVGIYL